MTERMLENRIKKLREIEAQQEALERQAEALKAEIKADMEAKGTDELSTKNFLVRWKEVVSSRLDGKALKEALPDVYSRYCKTTNSRRFTVA